MRVESAMSTAVEGRGRLVLLDGYRGLAAACVALYHFGLMFHQAWILPHARLAVDFFFLLSGFVVPYSYGDRLAKGLGLAPYLWLRAERLYPLVALGAILGAIVVLCYPATLLSGRSGLVMAAPLAVMALPDLASHNGPFPLNPPGWSVFYELLASAAFGLLAIRLRARTLLAVVAASGVAELLVAHHENGLRAVVQDGQIVPGVARVAFPFALGTLIYCLHGAGRLPNRRMPAALAFAVMLATFLPPFFYPHSWLGDVVITGALYPMILISGLTSKVPIWIGRLCERMGELSYPLYAVHYPVLSLALLIAGGQPRAGALTAAPIAVAVCTLLATIADRRVQTALKTIRLRRGVEVEVQKRT